MNPCRFLPILAILLAPAAALPGELTLCGGDRPHSICYSERCVDGKANGFGFLVDEVGGMVMGNFVGDRISGPGFWVGLDEDVYFGRFENGDFSVGVQFDMHVGDLNAGVFQANTFSRPDSENAWVEAEKAHQNIMEHLEATRLPPNFQYFAKLVENRYALISLMKDHRDFSAVRAAVAGEAGLNSEITAKHAEEVAQLHEQLQSAGNEIDSLRSDLQKREALRKWNPLYLAAMGLLLLGIAILIVNPWIARPGLRRKASRWRADSDNQRELDALREMQFAQGESPSAFEHGPEPGFDQSESRPQDRSSGFEQPGPLRKKARQRKLLWRPSGRRLKKAADTIGSRILAIFSVTCPDCSTKTIRGAAKCGNCGYIFFRRPTFRQSVSNSKIRVVGLFRSLGGMSKKKIVLAGICVVGIVAAGVFSTKYILHQVELNRIQKESAEERSFLASATPSTVAEKISVEEPDYEHSYTYYTTEQYVVSESFSWGTEYRQRGGETKSTLQGAIVKVKVNNNFKHTPVSVKLGIQFSTNTTTSGGLGLMNTEGKTTFHGTDFAGAMTIDRIEPGRSARISRFFDTKVPGDWVNWSLFGVHRRTAGSGATTVNGSTLKVRVLEVKAL